MKKYHKHIVLFNVLFLICISFFSFNKNVFADETIDSDDKTLVDKLKDSVQMLSQCKKMGDVNCDGKIDDTDVGILNDYHEVFNNKVDSSKMYDSAMEYRNIVEARGDINGDGVINQYDVDDLISVINTGHSSSGILEATNCAGLKRPELCNAGKTNSGRFGCVWNEKYEFCSPTGLAYLSCGSGSSDAHDIPVFLPRITSYAVVILKTATPIILIIMSMIQLIKAIASQNEDEMKKARSALVKKLIAAALVFFVTTIVQFVIKQVSDSSEVGSANQCLSCFVNNDCNGSMYYTDGYGKCYYISNKYTAVDCNTDIGVKERGLVEESKENNN